MSYNIEPMSVKQFVTDSQIKLPRFQRRSVWSDKQNFELCISIFQDYPVGVVIINKEPDSSWLLDGRQRRAALKEMRANPVSVYLWAKRYIGFSPTEDIVSLKDKYWQKIEAYLQKDKTNENEKTDDNIGDDEDYMEEFTSSFDADKQRKGLQTLLDLILMVHQYKCGSSAWQKLFDFSKYISLKYVNRRENNSINSERLRNFILDIIENNSDITEQVVIDFFEDNAGDLSEDKQSRFEEVFHQRWEDIEKAIDVIRRSERIISESSIGLIKLTNVSPLDAQNIFTRINSGGTALKAEELLSAKAFWNEPVTSIDPKVDELVKNMYRNLGVENQEGIVRWDIAATLLKRIDRKHLVFDDYQESEATNDVNLEQVTFGFKLLSAIFQGGITAKDVSDLEKNRAINWSQTIDELVIDLNAVFDLLLSDNFFKYWHAWGKPFAKLLGASIALEFITIVYKDWIGKGKPAYTSAQMKSVQRNARILLDRMICEYGTGVWLGSGDKKMAYHVANFSQRFEPMELSLWEKMIDGACAGEYNGQRLARKQVTPILYYGYVLQDLAPSSIDSTILFDVDHTMPQAWFEGNTLVDQKLKDSLSNLALLPKKENISKKDKALREVTDPWLIEEIVRYIGIPKSDFDTYSDITHIGQLHDFKLQKYKDLFKNQRQSKLAN